jgi:hypothetical protein
LIFLHFFCDVCHMDFNITFCLLFTAACKLTPD